MDTYLKVLFVDTSNGFYRIQRYPVGEFFGPVDLGLFLTGKYNSLNIGVGLFAGSIFPGSNRLIFTGFSPCWGGFYISSMGGAGLVFDNLAVNMISIIGRAASPSVLYLNRVHGEEIQVDIIPVEAEKIWQRGRGGVYSMMDECLARFGGSYMQAPRILAVGPAAMVTDFGAICSAPIQDNKVSFVDTWAGRGGFGTRLLQDHGIAAVIYGGTVIDEDFRDRTVAEQWFQDKYQKKLSAKDFEATTKYRFDPQFDTGGTFGVNYAGIGGRILAFNYKSIYMEEGDRSRIHQDFILNHYLAQFNTETIRTKSQRTCGEPCTAVCKKLREHFKKDYEPYQTMGPLCGIFDQRAAEKLNHQADMMGFDAISIGGILAGLMEGLENNVIQPEEVGVAERPIFKADHFHLEEDSMHNANLACAMMDGIIHRKGLLDFSQGLRKFLRPLARERGKIIINSFLYNAFARKGWSIPNQYWTPGVLSPMAIMGKYYMAYVNDFFPPRQLGRENAKRMHIELVLDNLGFCRFHRKWAEEMLQEIMDKLYGKKKEFLEKNFITASRINSRNSSIYWESERNLDFIYSFLQRKHDVEGERNPQLISWLDRFHKDKNEAGLDFWFEILKGVHESLREF